MADWASISKIKGNQYGGGSSGAAGFQAWGGGQTGVGGTGKPSATPQDLVAKFDAMDKRQIGPGSVGVQAPKEIAALGTTPKIDATGAQEATNPFDLTQIASTGKLERPGDNDGSGYKNLELNPVVNAKFQAWA